MIIEFSNGGVYARSGLNNCRFSAIVHGVTPQDQHRYSTWLAYWMNKNGRGIFIRNDCTPKKRLSSCINKWAMVHNKSGNTY
ncbi:hypothetical protein GCM10017717_18120 [Deinococcus persicinus]